MALVHRSSLIYHSADYRLYATVNVENDTRVEQVILIRIQPDPDKPSDIVCDYGDVEEYTAGSPMACKSG